MIKKKCRQCGKDLPNEYTTDICLECSKANLKKIFAKDPELKQAFIETIEDLRKPENVKKISDDTVRFMQAIQFLQTKE